VTRSKVLAPRGRGVAGVPTQGRSPIAVELASGAPTVVAAFLAIAISGLPTYAFGVLIGPIAASLGESTTTVAMWMLGWSLGSIACAFTIGSLADRFGPRRILLSFLPLYAAVLLAQAMLTVDVATLLLGGVVVGIGMTGIGAIPCSRLIAARFDQGLGTALGSMSAGVGCAALLAPVAIQRIVDAWGWRAGYLAMAAAALLVLPLIWRLTATGDHRIHAVAAPAPLEIPISHIIRSRAFLCLAAGTFLFGLLVTGTSHNLILYLGHLGFDRSQAAGVASALGVVTIVGRLATGYALDRLPVHIGVFMVVVLLLLAGSFAAAASGVTAAVFAALLLLGLAIGAEADCLSFGTVRLFGRRAYGRVFGILGVGILFAGAGVGPVAFRLCVDLVGYAGTFTLFSLGAAIGAAVLIPVCRAPYIIEDSNT